MRNFLYPVLAVSSAMFVLSCTRHPEPTPPTPTPPVVIDDIVPTKDTIPDFGRVGYRWGEKAFPTDLGQYTIVVDLPYPGGSDDTQMIQTAIDNAQFGTIIRLKAAQYKVAGIIALDKSGVVLQGATGADGKPATSIVAVGREESDIRDLLVMGTSVSQDGSIFTTESVSLAADDEHPQAYTLPLRTVRSTTQRQMWRSQSLLEDAFCGSTSVVVADASDFAPGDRVVIYRPATAQWISDIHMDQIVKDPEDVGTITQWTPAAYALYWERDVVAVKGSRVVLDNPLVMRTQAIYGGAMIGHCSMERIYGSGIENIMFISECDENNLDYDIRHAFNAIKVRAAEHCWIRNVQCRYFADSFINLAGGAKNITVRDCHSYRPCGQVKGGLRYAFHISKGELCLVDGCTCEYDRHAFVTGTKDPGPNVFNRCTATETLSDLGPHQRWATGTLYDHCVTDNTLKVQDAGNNGTGQGWQGASFVFWCCRADGGIVCQSPWVSAVNYAIGCTPASLSPGRGYPAEDVLGPRPNGVCRPLDSEEPEYLYETQLLRRIGKGMIISTIVPDKPAAPSEPSCRIKLTFSSETVVTPSLPIARYIGREKYSLYDDSGVKRQIEIFNSTGGFRFYSASLRLNEGNDSDGDARIKLPAVAGKALSGVYVTVNNSGTKSFTLGSSTEERSDICPATSVVPGERTLLSPMGLGTGMECYLYNTQKNTQITELELIYK